ncbi:uncharacterized protein FOMMEDRAFT_144145 [Fomitiporia mediterranea MF3/22]|uniref:uncharacterized protein n=1 Tax=Fomitiporia mediterranea (strain MF3/22) TaxID=694068 RepID=UPI0004408DDA|nr:uncharacterized protein FOMMEDRAFT_144145 [Fomitiporia mediterranea MF3/22]EJD08011.1 hypothetical protein FOMMEDRAFT_144145 [Fomitiporia mediterranea MF3/22]
MQKPFGQALTFSTEGEISPTDVISYLEENVLQHVDRTSCPPPHILLYAAQQLIESSLNCDNIQTLLEVLANIEEVRQRATQQARTALRLQEAFLEEQEPDIRLLNGMECRALESMSSVETDEATRLIFREDVVLNLYRLRICHLWTSPKSYTIGKVMRTYFPSKYAREGNPFADEQWTGVLHYGLTRAERERVHEVGREMKSCLSRAMAWDLERKNYFEELGLSEEVIFGESEFLSYKRDFDAKFRNTIDEAGMMEGLKAYLKKVQRDVNVLEKLFASGQQ